MVGLAVAVGTVWCGFHLETQNTEALGKLIWGSGIPRYCLAMRFEPPARFAKGWFLDGHFLTSLRRSSRFQLCSSPDGTSAAAVVHVRLPNRELRTSLGAQR